MCAWCFGFTRIFDEIRRRYKETVDFSIVMGGLRVDKPVTVNDGIKKMLYDNWTAVTRKTGQRISADLLESSPDFLYDSEPSCRAAVTVRKLKADAAFSYYKALHRLFYLEMKDLTDFDLLCEAAKDMGVDADAFRDLFNSQSTIDETRNDFSYARETGVLAFPALILKNGEKTVVLNQGYKPLDQLVSGIDRWLDGEPPMIHFFI